MNKLNIQGATGHKAAMALQQKDLNQANNKDAQKTRSLAAQSASAQTQK